jgi:hypothetical protein
MDCLDFVFVYDVYGNRSRVKRSDFDNPDKIMLPLYNQYGKRLDSQRGTRVTVIHRDNINLNRLDA